MSQYLSIIPQTPLHIGGIKPNFRFLLTQDIIPGSLIRGCLSEYLIRQGNKSKIKEYIKDTKFGFFYPSNSPYNFPFPFPLTSLSCKIMSGFKPKNHGVFDIIIPMIAYIELKKFGAKFPIPFIFKCKECGSKMDKYITGYYIFENRYRKIEVSKISQTKCALSRRRKTTQQKMLYSITGIDPIVKTDGDRGGIVFIGKISGANDKIDFIMESLNEIGIGGFTTRGFGNILAEKIEINIENLKKRIDLFNRKLSEIWKQMYSIVLNKNNKKIPEEPNSCYFTVDLLSPAILNENNIPTLKLQINLDNIILKPILFSTNHIFIGGWSTAWGLPKRTTYAAKIGSVYVFKTNKEGENINKVLESLEEKGIGAKRDEGYGEILICHPFHKEVIPI